MNKSLVFVYNADSGLFNAMTDFAHKIISPKTYQCNLCALTYSGLSMKQEWKEFVLSLHIPAQFLHKDEFAKQFGMKQAETPAVFISDGKALHQLVSTRAINACTSLEQLMDQVKEAIASEAK